MIHKEKRKPRIKRVLITGSSRGIGLAITKLLIEKDNFEIIGTSTSGNHPIQTENFKCLKLNLEQGSSITELDETINQFKIDYLINNAGILLEKWSDSSINFQQLEKTFQVNLFGTIRLTELLLPRINNGGHIINVASDWGSFSESNFNEFQPHYKMSKAALNMYTKLLSERTKKNKINVSSFDPGWVQTDMGSMEATRTPNEVAVEMINLMVQKNETGMFWHKDQIRKW